MRKTQPCICLLPCSPHGLAAGEEWGENGDTHAHGSLFRHGSEEQETWYQRPLAMMKETLRLLTYCKSVLRRANFQQATPILT